ncbi:hypothetical protein SASPL_104429 [Salvia splendens]|uniref:Uncharacterized protein n=1 Tax=Salvia splendens TaxID=180675 RepID=A0A8X8YMR0_SALSN|nr:hypothetical protein SASPL_104429 [Salvia splendens]
MVLGLDGGHSARAKVVGVPEHWNSTPEFIGMSENVTCLNSAPRYSRNRFELFLGLDFVHDAIIKAWKTKRAPV